MSIIDLSRAAGRDIGAALKMTPNVALLAWIDMEDRYRRSALGPLWMALTLGVMAGSLGFLYSKILKQPKTCPKCYKHNAGPAFVRGFAHF